MSSAHQISRGAAIATGAPAATEAGAEILRQGGTAADAAVAAALAMCVVDPANASLLGRCQIILRTHDGRFAAIDGSSAIPSSLPETLGAGPLALAPIPCLPQALGKLHVAHGRLPLSAVVAPAVRLAYEGVVPPPHLAAAWAENAERLAHRGAEPYLKDGRGVPSQFLHRSLGSLLQAFGQHGAAAITHGENARRLVDGVRAQGGFWRAEDLEGNAALDGEILHAHFRDCKVITVGRQGWGHTLVQILSILDRLPPFGEKLTGAEACCLLAVIESCLHDRPQQLGSLAPKPGGHALETLISPNFVAARSADVARWLAQDLPDTTPAERPAKKLTQGKDTTHLSTLDAAGGSVALTMSIGPHSGFVQRM